MTPTVRAAVAYLKSPRGPLLDRDEIREGQRALAGRARRSIPHTPVPPPPDFPDVVLLDEYRFMEQWAAIPSRIGLLSTPRRPTPVPTAESRTHGTPAASSCAQHPHGVVGLPPR